MRTINQIQIAVQEANPDISDEELRLCVESLRNIIYFYQNELLKLIKDVKEDKSTAKIRADFAWKTHESMFKAQKRTPLEWLGPKNIPGSPEQRRGLEWAKKVYEKATGEKL